MKNSSMGIVPLRPSFRYIVIRTAPWLIFFYGLLLATFLVSPLALILCWLALLIFFYHLFLLCAESYVMTPDSLMVSKGLLRKSVTFLPHLELKEHSVHQNWLMNLLDIVTISFVTKDDQRLRVRLTGIDRAALLSGYQSIIDQLENRQAACKYLIDLFEKLTPKP